MPPRRGLACVGFLAALGMVPAAGRTALGQAPGVPDSVFRDGFEGPGPAWRQETSDAAIRLRAHDRPGRFRFDGESAERFDFVAGLGSYFYFSYPLPRIALSDDLRAELHLRSNRGGMRLLGLVVLPADLDPETGRPATVVVQGSTYETPDQWGRLVLADLPSAVERQVRLLRLKSRRPISTEGAYLERLIVDLYGGVGETEVHLDGLAVAPVAAEAPEGPDAALPELPGLDPDPGPDAEPLDPGAEGTERLEFVRNRLSIYDPAGRRFFPWVPTIIHAPGADVRALRQHGFDVLAAREGADPEVLDQAVEAGLMLMPMLGRDPARPPGRGPIPGRSPIPRRSSGRWPSIRTARPSRSGTSARGSAPRRRWPTARPSSSAIGPSCWAWPTYRPGSRAWPPPASTACCRSTPSSPAGCR